MLRSTKILSAFVLILVVSTIPGRAVDVDPKVSSHAVIDQVFAAYEKAFASADVKQIGALWETDGEFVDPLGNRIVGRESIEKLFQDYFSRNRNAKLAIKILSLKEEEQGRVVVADVQSEVTPPPQGGMGKNQAVIVLVRSDDKWLIEGIKENNPLPASYEHLKTLQWMVGTWTAQAPADAASGVENQVSINTTCRWTANKSYLTRTLNTQIGQLVINGTEIIGWDPQAKTIRSWLFESSGGFTQSVWKSEGNKWIMEMTGVLSDGTPISAENIVTLVDNDTISYLVQKRLKGGEKQPDRGPIKIIRKRRHSKRLALNNS